MGGADIAHSGLLGDAEQPHQLEGVKPAITAWSSRITSFREVTSEDIKTALDERKPADSLHGALRSLFRALRQERVIFTDPTRRISLRRAEPAPRAVPSDLLMGIIDRTADPAGKLIVVLVALHALGPTDIARLKIADLNLSRGRLTVRRIRPHTVYLDELTLQLASAWLRERHDRWPASTNPHLITNQITAMDTEGPSIHRTMINRLFRKLNLNATRVRVDRIFHEAQISEDPIHLMRLFGVAETTAMKYVQAAHPERGTGWVSGLESGHDRRGSACSGQSGVAAGVSVPGRGSERGIGWVRWPGWGSLARSDQPVQFGLYAFGDGPRWGQVCAFVSML